MFERMSRSWELGKQSWMVLKGDKRLVVFPLLSSAACLLVMASFFLPIILWVQHIDPGYKKDLTTTFQHPLALLAAFGFYIVNFTVIAFFNAALIGCAMRRFEGEDATVSDGLVIAASRLPQILGWALVASSVGMVLRMISERSGLIGKIVVGLIGMVWSIATYFVVPVLVVEGLGPIAAVKRSAAVIKKTWGESLVANIGLSALSLVGFLVSLVPLAVGVAISISTQTVAPAVIGGAVMVLMLICVGLVTSTLQMILVAALYRYAATGLVPEQFDGQLLRQMFREKGSKR